MTFDDITSTTSTPDAPQTEPERRAFRRVHLETAVGVHTDTNFYSGFSEDLSEGGLFIATYDLQPVGTHVDVTFHLPGGIEIVTTGTVRWVRDPVDLEAATPGIGVQFEELSEETSRAIREFVQARDPMFWVD